MRYLCDMRGYGANPPDAAWPGGTLHVAVLNSWSIVEDGENCILHGDNKASGSLPFGGDGCRAIAGQTPLEHGIHLRIRRPRRFRALHRKQHEETEVPVTIYGVARPPCPLADQVAAMHER